MLVVLVVEAPAHKQVAVDARIRKRLADAAFPDFDVELDPHPYTVETLDSRRWADPVVLIGADQFAEFLSWKDPDGVLARARLGVATRPGYSRERFEPVLAALRRPERVELFEIEPVPISSSEVRERVSRGEPISGLVPTAVAELIAALGLYRGSESPGDGRGLPLD